VADAAGETRTARTITVNGYDLTVTGSLAVVEYLVNEGPAGGAYTPSQLMGKDFVTTLPGCGPIEVTA